MPFKLLPLSSATRRIPDGTGIRNVAELSGENSLGTRGCAEAYLGCKKERGVIPLGRRSTS